MNRNIENFYLDEIYSKIGFGNYDEIKVNRHIYTKIRYKNNIIFPLNILNHFMIKYQKILLMRI